MQNHAENQAGRLVPNLFLFFKKALYEVMVIDLQLSFNTFRLALNLVYNKYNVYNYWSRDMLNFDFLEKGLELVSLPNSLYDFSRKMFLMLYSINRSNFIVWLSLLPEILGNMCIAKGLEHTTTYFVNEH